MKREVGELCNDRDVIDITSEEISFDGGSLTQNINPRSYLGRDCERLHRDGGQAAHVRRAGEL